MQTRRNITQPEDWWEAFSEEAKLEQKSLSEWIGECCLTYLPAKVQKRLSKRRPAHRPVSNEKEQPDGK